MNGVGAITIGGWQAWRAEGRATIVLAWPLILTNLAQTAMTATDVLLMGRLGPETLAAGALGSNLYFATMIFGLGLTTATAPMIARELGRKSHSVRDVRRTVRQGLWAAVVIAVPIWLVLWHTEAILLAMGQRPDLALHAGHYMRTLQCRSCRFSSIWCCVPSSRHWSGRNGPWRSVWPAWP